MVMARAEVLIDRTADEIWARIRDFGDVSWIPNTESSRLDGDIRTVQMKGVDFDETQRLLHHDDATRSYSYRLTSNIDFESIFGPGNKFTGLQGSIALEPCGASSCRVTYDVETDEFLVGVVNREYQGALDNLKALMEA